MDKLKIKKRPNLKATSALSASSVRPKPTGPVHAAPPAQLPTSEDEQLGFAHMAQSLTEMLAKYPSIRGEAILAMLGQHAGQVILQGAPPALHDEMTQLVLNNILAVLTGQTQKAN